MRPLSTFRELDVVPDIAEALESVGIREPFPIQAAALPIALVGADLIGQAKTGTGKTLAFGIPLLQRTLPASPDHDRRPRALVVVPTRELCLQVTGDIEAAGRTLGVRVLSVYGGRAYEPQIDRLQAGVDVVVGTPGRLLDLAQRGSLRLDAVQVLVLDEADEMLDMGFLPDVEKIIDRTPDSRQTLLFSATMPGQVVGLARRYMRQPTNVRAHDPDDAGATVAATTQHVFRAHALDKPEMLARILQADGRGLTIVFCRTKRTAARVAEDLTERGYAAAAVHGDLGQGQREQALRAFRKGKVDVLVATDVAARGIDIGGVTHVVNYQCPEDEKMYVHRIGRTGRAGASGVAVTLVDWDEVHRWNSISDALGLPYNDPVETYSTSEHLYATLGIPAGATGSLPTGKRTRTGLASEEVEDLGVRTREHKGTQRARSRRGGDGGQTGHRSGNRERPRQRRRLRNGRPLGVAPEGSADHAGQAPASGETTAEGRPRRRRSRGGRRRRGQGGAGTGSTDGGVRQAAS